MPVKAYLRLVVFILGGFTLVSAGFYIRHCYQFINAITQNQSRSTKKKIKLSIPFDSNKLEEFFECGDQEYKKGNLESAITNYRKALATYPSIVEALLRLGKTFAKQDKHELAIIEYKSALTINPRHLVTYLLLSRSLHAQKKAEDAIIILERALTLNPTCPEIYIELAKMFTDTQEYDKALSLIDKAEQCNPKNVNVLLNRGHVLNWKGDIVGAIEAYKKATLLDPTCANAHYNLGHTLKVYGKMHDAINSLTKAAELDSYHIDTHIALSHAYWALGDFKNAWQEYEWRWKRYKKNQHITGISQWHGQELKDKTILLYSEQGLGDTLQFIRFAQELKKNGATVWCKVQKPLINLLSWCPYIDHLVTNEDQKELRQNINFQAPLMSMPGILKTTPQTIPALIPYLYADSSLIKKWKDRLAQDKKLKIGICWHVEQHHEIYKLPIAKRAISIQNFLPLANHDNISLYCLQRSDENLQNKIPNELQLTIFPTDFDNTNGRFMDSAAVIANLDIIITVDTAIAHLAGGLGKEVWMLLPYSSDCRWYLQSDRSPWYPTMRIFRQPEPGNWKVVMDKINNEITKLIDSNKALHS